MSRFVTTHWSLILSGQHGPRKARAALEEICDNYRRPVLSYIREHGYASADAEDLTQEFFTRLIEQRWDARADPSRGRFRSFLLTALHRFLVNEQAARHADKRGGLLRQVELDEAVPETSAVRSPEQAFNHAWAMTVLARAAQRLEQEARAAGREALYRQLSAFLVETPGPDEYRQVAEALDLKPNTVAVNVQRLRKRLRELIREELTETVSDAGGLDAELHALGEVVGSGMSR